jgi:hypothetical protein
MKKWPTEADLRRYLTEWQYFLRLQQWKIKIRYAGTREMSGDDGSIAWGRCYQNEDHLRAKITILHPDQYEDDEGRNEIEVTVVHELLHLLLGPLRRECRMPDKSGDIAEEQSINVLAEILVELKTGDRVFA